MILRYVLSLVVTILFCVFSAILVAAQSECWDRLHTRQVAFNLTDAAVLSEQTALIVGYNGSILRTVDGGRNWLCWNDGSFNRFNTVYFLDEEFGMVAGELGRIYRSNDGGETWSQDRISGIIDFINDVHILDRRNAVAVGGTITPSNIILRTTDGGETWVNQPSGTTATLYGVWMIDSLNVWTVGLSGLVLHSVDGGQSWETVDIGMETPFRLTAIAFADERTGMIVGDEGTVFFTLDGGESWEPVVDPKSGTNFFDVEWFDSQHGLAVGEGVAMRTTDGGETWSQVHPHGYYLGLGVERGGDAAVAVGVNGLIHTTTDRGANWVRASSLTATVLLDGIGASDTSHIIATSLKGDVLWTRDGGATWGWSHTGPATLLKQVLYPSPDLALLIGGTMFRSTDQGETWTNVEPPAGRFLQRGDMLDERRGMVVGNNVILRTSDGGVSWDIDTTSVETNLYAVSMYDALHAFAVGRRGAMYRTEDGGETWQEVKTAFTAHFYDVKYFPSGDVVVGHNKGIVRSTDHGATWTIYDLPNGQTCYGWSCLSPQTAYCAQDLGSIMRTTDGGATWVKEKHNVAEAGHLFAIHFLDERTGYLAGADGYILRYTSPDSSSSVQEVIRSSRPSAVPGLSLVPNPARDEVTVRIEGVEGKSVRSCRVLDIAGRIVREVEWSEAEQPHGSVFSLSLTGLPEGYYVVQVADEGGKGRSLSASLLIR